MIVDLGSDRTQSRTGRSRQGVAHHTQRSPTVARSARRSTPSTSTGVRVDRLAVMRRASHSQLRPARNDLIVCTDNSAPTDSFGRTPPSLDALLANPARIKGARVGDDQGHDDLVV